ncbi:hypothetical protein J2Z44_002869 [Clostridium punense]|uniref:Lipoprotein n=1 Tax=Clostridium punense TaxID=1054297 RepID=A0ABS4K8X6_9CLOT|nr:MULTISPECIES: hypothetical protein [Clostridium]EQB87262.1 hypothetical protein M918_09830 [Clostridium sp. BL8]MBP2023044.1 hypothetical protein [Clostridium punense]
MKKSLKVLMAFGAATVIITGCQSKTQLSSSSITETKAVAADSFKIPEGYKVIGNMPDRNIYLLGKDGEKAGYDRFLLHKDGVDKEFNWKSVMKTPNMQLCDLNDDGKEELATIVTTGYGTGFLEQKIHVVDLETMDEVKVDDPVEVTKNNVKTYLSSDKVVFSLNGEDFSYSLEDKASSTAEEEFKNLTYGTFITHYLENNKIKTKVDARTNPNSSLTQFEITYKYSEEGFVPENLKIASEREQ